MVQWISRINLLWTFAALFVFHVLMYSLLGNPSWFILSMIATVVDTVALAVVRYFVRGAEKSRVR